MCEASINVQSKRKYYTNYTVMIHVHSSGPCSVYTIYLCIIAWWQVFPLIFLTVYTSQMHPKPLQCMYLKQALICCTATRWGLWLKHLAPGYKSIITPHYHALAVYKHSALGRYAPSGIMHIYQPEHSMGCYSIT